MATERLDRKAMLGHKIRRFRLDQGLSQTEMAAQIGISPSYLNLIEHNQRPVTVPLLFKLGNAFEIDLKEFAEGDDQRLAAGLSEVFGDPLFEGQAVSEREMRELVASAPAAAQGVLTLYRAYRRIWENAQALAHEAGGDGTADGPLSPDNPVEAVRDVLEAAANHFDDLERAAEELWEDAGLDRDTLFAGLRVHTKAAHGIDVRVMPVEVMGDTLRRWDHHRRRILISETLLPSARIFHLGVQLALISHRERLDRIVERADLQSDDGRDLFRMTLANYFASAVMMPYGPFLQAAKDLRYDIELLRRRFGASVEQVCHRLTTMQRSGARGVPFFFLRVDNAGNISKRLSGGGFQFARFGGTCPRLVVHDVFRSPGQLNTQVVRLPDDTTFLIIARTLDPIGGGRDPLQPRYSIALGCELKDSRHLIYGDSVDPKRPGDVTPAGVSCRVCERLDCTQRAHPPVNHKLRVDQTLRRAQPFDFVR
jgi:XRE family transcriptional regulator, fatty acid utilization regulator